MSGNLTGLSASSNIRESDNAEIVVVTPSTSCEGAFFLWLKDWLYRPACSITFGRLKFC